MKKSKIKDISCFSSSSKKRTCVYIDGANFFGGLTSLNKRFTDTKFDFENYVQKIIGNNSLIKVYYYNALIKKRINEKIWKKQKSPFERLNKLPKWKVSLCTRKSRLNILGEEYHTIKGDDLMLALDAMEDCYNDVYDRAIIISGDGDFTELLKRIRNKEKEVEICYFDNCVSKVLLKNANKIRLINKKTVKKFFYIGKQ